MASGAEWETDSGARSNRLSHAGVGVIRIAFLFGSAAVALALILTPIADKRTRSSLALSGVPFGIDPITTASTKRGAGTYTVRRSVLQPTRDAVCVIRENGSRSGHC